MAKQRTNLDYKTTRKERLSYGIYFAGQNVFFMLITSFVATYFLDIGITASASAAMLLLVKVWDAINDPIFGGIVDKVRLKGGRFIPWLRLSVIAIPISTVLIFAIPSSLSPTLKLVWGGVAYVLWDTAYTISDVPIYGLITRMSDNQNERMSIMSISRVSGVLAAMLTVVLVPAVRASLGGWLPTIIAFTVIALITMIPVCFTAKERIHTAATEKDITFKEMFDFIKNNKYILIFFSAFLVLQASGIGTTLSMILARNLFGNESVSSLLQLMSLLPSIVLGLFMPKILKKVDKYKLFMGSIIANATLGIIIYFVGYSSLPLYLLLLAIRGIPFGTFYVLLFMFTPDCVEYGTFKTGVSAAGVGFSFQSFTSKMATAIASSLGLYSLSLLKFVEGENAVQLAGFNDKLWMVYNLVPAAGAIIAVLILTRYKLRDEHVKVLLKANGGEITHEEAEAQLNGKI